MNGKSFTLRNLYQSGTEKLEKAGIREAKLDAWYLLEYKTGISRAVFLADPDREVEEEKAESYQKDICTRARRIPLQHITGEQEFMGLNFKVNENVLVPFRCICFFSPNFKILSRIHPEPVHMSRICISGLIRFISGQKKSVVWMRK